MIREKTFLYYCAFSCIEYDKHYTNKEFHWQMDRSTKNRLICLSMFTLSLGLLRYEVQLDNLDSSFLFEKFKRL